MKKLSIWNYAGKFLAMSLAGSILLFTACKEEEPAPDITPVATFTYEVSADNFLSVSFNSEGSKNAASWAWNFGDDNVSAEQNPTHLYTAAGNFTVSLQVTNTDGVASNIFTQDISITDPNEQLTLLAGTVSKDWKLIREGNAVGVGPVEGSYEWFALLNDGVRPCYFDDVFTFHRDGGFDFNDGGTFWGEGKAYTGTDKENLLGTCFEATVDNLTIDGVDKSAWLSSTTHTYSYSSTENEITLTGTGVWMGLYVLATTEEVSAPQESVSFKATLADGGASGVDTLTAVWDYNGVVWNARYVSYDGTTPEPALVSFNVDFTFAVDARTVTFTNESKDAISYSWDFGDGNTSTDENPVHTYAADGTYAVKLTGTGSTGSKEVTKNVIVDTQTLTTVAPAPTEPEANVISIYSDTYTDIAGVNLNPNWGQATVTSEVEVLTGEMVLKMAGLNYQGIDWAGTPQDVSAKTKLHLDIWCPVVTDINVSLISSGAENPVTIATEAGVWKSVDILLSDYTVPDKTATIQIKFDDAATGTAPTIYVDNIYFY